jgi:hypothetical protein
MTGTMAIIGGVLTGKIEGGLSRRSKVIVYWGLGWCGRLCCRSAWRPFWLADCKLLRLFYYPSGIEHFSEVFDCRLQVRQGLLGQESYRSWLFQLHIIPVLWEKVGAWVMLVRALFSSNEGVFKAD